MSIISDALSKLAYFYKLKSDKLRNAAKLYKLKWLCECCNGNDASQRKSQKHLDRSSQKLACVTVMDATRHAKFYYRQFRGLSTPNM